LPEATEYFEKKIKVQMVQDQSQQIHWVFPRERWHTSAKNGVFVCNI